MQFFRNSQGVILSQKHLSFPSNFVQFTKILLFICENEIFVI